MTPLFGMGSSASSNQQPMQASPFGGQSAAPFNQQGSQGVGGLGALAAQTPPGGFPPGVAQAVQAPGFPVQPPPGGFPPGVAQAVQAPGFPVQPPPGGLPPEAYDGMFRPQVMQPQVMQQQGMQPQAVLPYMGADRQQLTPQQQLQRAMSDIADRDRFRNQQPQPQQIRQEEPRMQASRYIQQLANQNRGGM